MAEPSTRDWADAYLAQARADLVGAGAVNGTEASVFAMLMQMVFEKFAKAALLRSGIMSVADATGTHVAASRMVAVMRRNRKTLDVPGGAVTWSKAFELVEALERAQPQVARRAGGGPQLEYPWAEESEIRWPARHLAVAERLGDPTTNAAPRLLAFARMLDQHFDALFE